MSGGGVTSDTETRGVGSKPRTARIGDRFTINPIELSQDESTL